jgi:hypothetical protein
MADLVTVNQYKTYRGITGDTEDTRLNVLIPALSELVKGYCGRSLIDNYSTEKTEYFTIKYPQDVVFLSEFPLNTITSVKESSSYLEDSDYTTLTASQYEYDTNLDALYRVEEGVRKDFPIGINSVEVIYTAGYETTPQDLRLAVFDLITYYLNDEHKPELNHASFTIRRADPEANFPEHIKRVLDRYKDV